MDTIQYVLFLAALMLLFVISLSALSAFSKMMTQSQKTEESYRSWEGGFLILLVFLQMLAIMVWRST